MSKGGTARKDSVLYTGAAKGDVLVAIWPGNAGFKIMALDDIPSPVTRGNLRVPIRVIDAGDGDYAKDLKPYEGKVFEDPSALVSTVKAAAERRLGRKLQRVQLLYAHFLKVDE